MQCNPFAKLHFLLAGLIVVRAVSVVLLLACCTLAGCGQRSASTQVTEMPVTLWSPGDANVEIHASLSHPGELNALFDQTIWLEEEDDWHSSHEMRVRQQLEAGDYRFPIQVGDNVSAYLRIQLHAPPPGATVRWSITIDGKSIWKQEDELTETIAGRTLFVRAVFDDLAKGEFSELPPTEKDSPERRLQVASL